MDTVNLPANTPPLAAAVAAAAAPTPTQALVTQDMNFAVCCVVRGIHAAAPHAIRLVSVHACLLISLLPLLSEMKPVLGEIKQPVFIISTGRQGERGVGWGPLKLRIRARTIFVRKQQQVEWHGLRVQWCSWGWQARVLL